MTALALDQPGGLVRTVCAVLDRPRLTLSAERWIQRVQLSAESLFFQETGAGRAPAADDRGPAALIADELDGYARRVVAGIAPICLFAIFYVVEDARRVLSAGHDDSLSGFADVLEGGALSDAECGLLLATAHAICDVVARMAQSLRADPAHAAAEAPVPPCRARQPWRRRAGLRGLSRR